MKKKHTKDKWFVKVRGSYLPKSWQGWLTYVPFMAYLLFSFAAIRSVTDSILVMVYLLLPAWVAAGVIMTWVAQRKS